MKIAQMLRGSSLFNEFSDRELDYLIKDSEVILEEKGKRIVKEGDPIKDFIFIVEGSASQYKNLNTELVEVQCLKKYDFFGEDFVCDFHSYQYDIIVHKSFTALKIKTEKIIDLEKKYPRAYASFITGILKEYQLKQIVALGIISRLYHEEKAPIGFPLFGQRPLSPEEARRKKIEKQRKKSA